MHTWRLSGCCWSESGDDGVKPSTQAESHLNVVMIWRFNDLSERFFSDFTFLLVNALDSNVSVAPMHIGDFQAAVAWNLAMMGSK